MATRPLLPALPIRTGARLGLGRGCVAVTLVSGRGGILAVLPGLLTVGSLLLAVGVGLVAMRALIVGLALVRLRAIVLDGYVLLWIAVLRWPRGVSHRRLGCRRLGFIQPPVGIGHSPAGP